MKSFDLWLAETNPCWEPKVVATAALQDGDEDAAAVLRRWLDDELPRRRAYVRFDPDLVAAVRTIHAATGLRAAQLAALPVAAIVRVEGGFAFATADGDLALPEPALGAVKTLLKSRATRPVQADPLVASADGTPWTAKQIGYVLRRAG